MSNRSTYVSQGWFPIHIHGTPDQFGAPDAENYESVLRWYVEGIAADGFIVHPDERELEYDGTRITVRVLVKHKPLPPFVMPDEQTEAHARLKALGGVVTEQA